MQRILALQKLTSAPSGVTQNADLSIAECHEVVFSIGGDSTLSLSLAV
ncbi:MAG: hypothetical protein JO125_02655 [Chloroflexi bacterium]|nr:hypothetical protein [Chloroflexota bacterium]